MPYKDKKQKILHAHFWYLKNRERILKMRKQDRINQPVKFSERKRRYYYKNRLQLIKMSIKWNKEHSYIHQHFQNRNLKFIQLFDNPFPEEIKIDYHHINNILVVPIPSITHEKSYCRYRDKHREKCNIFLNDIYNIDFNKLLEVN